MTEQYQVFEVVRAALVLGLFQKLANDGEMTDRELIQAMNWDQETTVSLLKVLVHAGYLEAAEGRYRNTQLTETYLVPDSFLYLGHKLLEFTGSFGDQVIRCIKKEPETCIRPEPDWNPERLRQIGVTALDGSIQNTVNACNLAGIRQLLDLGGGHGFYSIAFAQKYPDIKITLFDLPQVVVLAKQFVGQFHQEERINMVAGNFLQDKIGDHYEAILCANILHSDKRDIVLTKVKEALTPDGMLIVKCRIADCPDTMENALVRLMWQIRGGKELFTTDQWRGFLLAHGFKNIRILNINEMSATIVANK